MGEKSIGKKLQSLLYAGILAGELAVILDAVSVYNGTALSVLKFGMLFAGLFLLLLLFPGFRMEQKRLVAAVCTAVLVIPMTVGYLCWHSVSKSVVYCSEDEGKQALYGGKNVMLLVPHQDDDINVLVV